MFLLNGVREEGAVLIAAYNKSTKQRCGVMFIDAKSALSLTSPMELREAQKLKQKSAGLAAKKPGARASSKGAKGLKDMAKMALARLELQKQVERECLTKALLMRFLVNNKTGMLMCRLFVATSRTRKLLFCWTRTRASRTHTLKICSFQSRRGFWKRKRSLRSAPAMATIHPRRSQRSRLRSLLSRRARRLSCCLGVEEAPQFEGGGATKQGSSRFFFCVFSLCFCFCFVLFRFCGAWCFVRPPATTDERASARRAGPSQGRTPPVFFNAPFGWN